MFELTMTQQVIRDRITEESVRKRDAHEIVDWIHGLEDEAAGLERRIRELEAAVRLALDLSENGLIDYQEHGLTCHDDIEQKYRNALEPPR